MWLYQADLKCVFTCHNHTIKAIKTLRHIRHTSRSETISKDLAFNGPERHINFLEGGSRG